MVDVRSVNTMAKTTVTGIRLDETSTDRLRRQAEFEGLTPSSLAKRCVENYLTDTSDDPTKIRKTKTQRQAAALARAKGTNGTAPAPFVKDSLDEGGMDLPDFGPHTAPAPAPTKDQRVARARKRTRFADQVSDVPTFFKGGK